MCITLVTYGFIQPYKSLTANFIEMAVQVIFIILLALESTSFLRDVYNVFPAPAGVTTSVNPNATDACTDGLPGVSVSTAILLPLYYAPVLLFIIVAVMKFIWYIM